MKVKCMCGACARGHAVTVVLAGGTDIQTCAVLGQSPKLHGNKTAPRRSRHFPPFKFSHPADPALTNYEV